MLTQEQASSICVHHTTRMWLDTTIWWAGLCYRFTSIDTQTDRPSAVTPAVHVRRGLITDIHNHTVGGCSYAPRVCNTCSYIHTISTILNVLIFLYLINPRRTCAARVTVVVVSVSQSVTRHLTSLAVNRSTNNIMFSALGIIMSKNVWGFSETAASGS